MQRRNFLLSKVAEYLNDGRVPFTGEFLQEFDVTADECFDLSSLTATAIETFLIITEPK